MTHSLILIDRLIFGSIYLLIDWFNNYKITKRIQIYIAFFRIPCIKIVHSHISLLIRLLLLWEGTLISLIVRANIVVGKTVINMYQVVNSLSSLIITPILLFLGILSDPLLSIITTCSQHIRILKKLIPLWDKQWTLHQMPKIFLNHHSNKIKNDPIEHKRSIKIVRVIKTIKIHQQKMIDFRKLWTNLIKRMKLNKHSNFYKN